jgi:hypothetical protein
MRFLFVYQAHAATARKLVQELLITDVIVIVVRKDELHPNDEELKILRQHNRSEAAACEVNRKYRKNVDPYVRFTLAPTKFRIDDQQLREWLCPATLTPDTVASPVVAFEEASLQQPKLLIHPKALLRADDLDDSRWAFVSRCANLLSRLAQGEDLGPLREWEQRYGVPFAANGQVSFSYRYGEQSRSSEWHLKSGDRTTPERAARIYFTQEKPAVLVFYVGPHPVDGRYTVMF